MGEGFSNPLSKPRLLLLYDWKGVQTLNCPVENWCFMACDQYVGSPG